MNSWMLKEAMYALKSYLRTEGTDDVEKAGRVIVKHGLAAAAAAVASGWIPGAGGMVAVTIGIGFVWAMYYQLSVLFGIKISKNILKTIASVVVAEVAAYLSIMLAAVLVFSFVPGLNLGVSALTAVINFGMVYVAGYIYLVMMTTVCKAGRNVETMTEQEWCEEAKKAASESDIESVYKEAKNVHKETKDSNEYSDYKDVKPLS